MAQIGGSAAGGSGQDPGDFGGDKRSSPDIFDLSTDDELDQILEEQSYSSEKVSKGRNQKKSEKPSTHSKAATKPRATHTKTVSKDLDRAVATATSSTVHRPSRPKTVPHMVSGHQLELPPPVPAMRPASAPPTGGYQMINVDPYLGGVGQNLSVADILSVENGRELMKNQHKIYSKEKQNEGRLKTLENQAIICDAKLDDINQMLSELLVSDKNAARADQATGLRSMTGGQAGNVTGGDQAGALVTGLNRTNRQEIGYGGQMGGAQPASGMSGRLQVGGMGGGQQVGGMGSGNQMGGNVGGYGGQAGVNGNFQPRQYNMAPPSSNWRNQGPGHQGGNQGMGPGQQGGNQIMGPGQQGGNQGVGPGQQIGNQGMGPGHQGGNQGVGPGQQGGNQQMGPGQQGGNQGMGRGRGGGYGGFGGYRGDYGAHK